MKDLDALVTYSFWDYVVNVILYVVLAIGSFAMFWVLFRDKLKHRRIQQKRTTSTPRLKSEIKNSIVSLLIFTAIDASVYFAQLKGYTQIYTNVSTYGWAWLVVSILIMMFLHDTWFYFVHRLMHHPKIYKHVHRVHHQSTDPSPFAAFSFHPIEAVLESGVYVVFAFLMPVHLVALWGWQLLQLALNVIAHLGYEIYPKGFNTHWLFKFKTPSTHHNMHHEKFHGNYALYFTWWDKLFNTEFKNYNQVYDAIHERLEKSKLNQETNGWPAHIIHNSTIQDFKLSRKAS